MLLGYGFGVVSCFIWHYIQTPDLNIRLQQTVRPTLTASSALIVSIAIYFASNWPNELRTTMDYAKKSYFYYAQMIVFSLFFTTISNAILFLFHH